MKAINFITYFVNNIYSNSKKELKKWKDLHQ